MSRVAIVTGGAAGIGAATGAALMAAGDQVTLADIDAAAAAATADELNARDLPGRAEPAALDVTDADEVQRLVDDVVRRRGRLDLIMNNAGVGVGGGTDELDLTHWDRAIDVNLRGVVHGVHAALPVMAAQRSGTIVNIASLAGLIPAPYLAPYSATKFAVVGMTLSMRAEWRTRGVRFSVVCPGWTDTAILDKGLPEDLPQLESLPDVRQMAAGSPGGIYPVADLADDIVAGIEADDAMVVAPRAARMAWRAYRTSPGLVMNALAKQTEQHRERSKGPETP